MSALQANTSLRGALCPPKLEEQGGSDEAIQKNRRENGWIASLRSQ
jgi:hypothetical protein